MQIVRDVGHEIEMEFTVTNDSHPIKGRTGHLTKPEGQGSCGPAS